MSTLIHQTLSFSFRIDLRRARRTLTPTQKKPLSLSTKQLWNLLRDYEVIIPDGPYLEPDSLFYAAARFNAGVVPGVTMLIKPILEETENGDALYCTDTTYKIEWSDESGNGALDKPLSPDQMESVLDWASTIPAHSYSMEEFSEAKEMKAWREWAKTQE